MGKNLGTNKKNTICSIILLVVIIAMIFGYLKLTELIAILLADLAIYFSLKTDETVISLAYLNFDEKIAAIKGYRVNIELTLQNPDLLILSLDKLYSDVKAVCYLKGHVSKEKQNELKTKLNEIIIRVIEYSQTNKSFFGDDKIMAIEREIEKIKGIVDHRIETAPVRENRRSSILASLIHWPSTWDRPKMFLGFIIAVLGWLFFGASMQDFVTTGYSINFSIAIAAFFAGFSLFLQSLFTQKDKFDEILCEIRNNKKKARIG